MSLNVEVVVLVFASAARASGAQPAGVSEIDWALSAAPAAIAAGAAVVDMSDDGKLTELSKGTNAWTCVVHDPGTPSGHPLCLDRNGLEWMQTAMSGREPDPAETGYSCMLKGGTAWNATDVTATKLQEGQEGRHPRSAALHDHECADRELLWRPSGETNPDTHTSPS